MNTLRKERKYNHTKTTEYIKSEKKWKLGIRAKIKTLGNTI
jgi:hypothetical protein